MDMTLQIGPAAVAVRDLEPADEAAVLDVFTAAEDWFVAETGQPSAPGDVQSSFYSLPEGAALDDKVLLVIEADGEVVGYIDAVLHYPHPTSIRIGTFLIRPEARRRGIGRAVAEALSAAAGKDGFAQISTHVAPGWGPGRQFLAALGYEFSDPRLPGPANRRPGPYAGPVIPAVRTLPAEGQYT
jgi:GNAT superfamily N-acetyltransferase